MEGLQHVVVVVVVVVDDHNNHHIPLVGVRMDYVVGEFGEDVVGELDAGVGVELDAVDPTGAVLEHVAQPVAAVDAVEVLGCLRRA